MQTCRCTGCLLSWTGRTSLLEGAGCARLSGPLTITQLRAASSKLGPGQGGRCPSQTPGKGRSSSSVPPWVVRAVGKPTSGLTTPSATLLPARGLTPSTEVLSRVLDQCLGAPWKCSLGSQPYCGVRGAAQRLALSSPSGDSNMHSHLRTRTGTCPLTRQTLASVGGTPGGHSPRMLATAIPVWSVVSEGVGSLTAGESARPSVPGVTSHPSPQACPPSGSHHSLHFNPPLTNGERRGTHVLGPEPCTPQLGKSTGGTWALWSLGGAVVPTPRHLGSPTLCPPLQCGIGEVWGVEMGGARLIPLPYFLKD